MDSWDKTIIGLMVVCGFIGALVTLLTIWIIVTSEGGCG